MINVSFFAAGLVNASGHVDLLGCVAWYLKTQAHCSGTRTFRQKWCKKDIQRLMHMVLMIDISTKSCSVILFFRSLVRHCNHVKHLEMTSTPVLPYRSPQQQGRIDFR